MLKGPINRSVDLCTLVICFGNQHFKEPLPDTLLTPAHLITVNHFEVTKAFLQITPGNADMKTVELRFEREAIVFGSIPYYTHSIVEQFSMRCY